jgi:hypothetical protein
LTKSGPSSSRAALKARPGRRKGGSRLAIPHQSGFCLTSSRRASFAFPNTPHPDGGGLPPVPQNAMLWKRRAVRPLGLKELAPAQCGSGRSQGRRECFSIFLASIEGQSEPEGAAPVCPRAFGAHTSLVRVGDRFADRKARPIPPNCRVTWRSPCSKASNTRSICLGSIPIPASSTSTVTLPSAAVIL